MIQKYFNEITDSLINSAEKYTFNLKDLPNVHLYTPNRKLGIIADSIRHHEKFEDMFIGLDSKKNSCLYWWELDEQDCCNTLIKQLNSNRPTLFDKGRLVPVSNNNFDSKYLYVGKRNKGWTKKWKLSNISGRIIHHLGYYAVGTTQGLQLGYWASNLDLNITLNVVEFDEDFPNTHLYALEKIMAHKLNPLCGKH